MRDGPRLRRLRVRVRREHRVAMPRRQIDERGSQLEHAAASRATNSRCRIRYIVMSMSLRLRAVCRRPAMSSPPAFLISRSM